MLKILNNKLLYLFTNLYYLLLNSVLHSNLCVYVCVCLYTYIYVICNLDSKLK